MNGKMRQGLLLALVFQFLVLTGMYVSAAMPLWTGKEIKVRTVPVDPRSLFRGNYARLSYNFSRIDAAELEGREQLRTGEVIYIVLTPTADGLYEYSKATLERPDGGVFLRGRLRSRHFAGRPNSSLLIEFGIEAFFAPKVEALDLEDRLRDGGVAVLMVADSGKARLKEVIGEL